MGYLSGRGQPRSNVMPDAPADLRCSGARQPAPRSAGGPERGGRTRQVIHSYPARTCEEAVRSADKGIPFAPLSVVRGSAEAGRGLNGTRSYRPPNQSRGTPERVARRGRLRALVPRTDLPAASRERPPRGGLAPMAGTACGSGPIARPGAARVSPGSRAHRRPAARVASARAAVKALRFAPAGFGGLDRRPRCGWICF
jgi:hypothetical protein